MTGPAHAGATKLWTCSAMNKCQCGSGELCTLLLDLLTHCGPVISYGIIDLGEHWFKQCLITCSVPSHYLKPCIFIVNSSVSQIPVCTAVSRSDEKNPEHLWSPLSGHVSDRDGQWAEWWLASACQPCECAASYRLTQIWSGSAMVTHSTQATPPWQCDITNA